MYYIYILFSPSSNRYYIGYSIDPSRRLEEHNTKPLNTFTSKHRSWLIAAVFECSTEEGEAMRIEKFKEAEKQETLQQLVNPRCIPVGELVQLARVPHLQR